MLLRFFSLLIPLFLYSEVFQITLYDLAHIVSQSNGVNIAIDEDISHDVTLFFTSPVEGKISLDTFKILSEKKGFSLKELDKIYYLSLNEESNATKKTEYEYLSVDIQHLQPEKVADIASSFDIESKQIFASGYLLKFPRESEKELNTFLNIIRQNNSRHVRITGEIIEISNDMLDNRGLDFSLFVESINRFGDLDLNFFAQINQNDFIKSYLQSNKNKINLTGFLNFLKTEGIARTITTPNLLVANHERSKFHSGQKIPIRSTTNSFYSNNSYTPYSTNNYTYLEVGLIVDVGARIFNQVIELDFKLDHITIDKYTENEQAITSNKTFHSRFSMLNHKQIVIAGLSKESTSTKQLKVPLISEIPLLGELFQTEYKTDANTSLIILLTADLEML